MCWYWVNMQNFHHCVLHWKKKVPRGTYFETNFKPLKRFRTDLDRFQSALKVSMKLFWRFRRAVRNLKKGLEFVSILWTFLGFRTDLNRFQNAFKITKKFLYGFVVWSEPVLGSVDVFEKLNRTETKILKTEPNRN